MIDRSVLKRGLIALGILGVFILAFLVLKEILVPLTIGLLTAYAFSPLYKLLLGQKKAKTLIAFLMILALVLIIVVPLIYLTPAIINQTFSTYVSIQNTDLSSIFRGFVSEQTADAISIQLSSIIGKFFSSILSEFSNLLVNLPSLILKFAVFLFTFFFALRDSDKLKAYVSSLSPFSQATEEKLMKEFRGITNAIIFGQVLIGVTQGLALGIALFLLGIPKALILTVLAMILSIIPVLGSWIIWLPVSVILLITGRVFEGTFLLFYGALFVSTIDNLLRPYLLSKNSNLPISVSILGTIGGLYFFGITGLIFGPLVFAYALIILDFYRKGKLDELFQKN